LSAPDPALPAAGRLPWVIHDGRRVRTGTASELRPSFGALLRDYRRRAIAVPYPGGVLKFGARTLVMGILNVTPDSFSDGGRFLEPDRAVEAGLAHDVRGAAEILEQWFRARPAFLMPMNGF